MFLKREGRLYHVYRIWMRGEALLFLLQKLEEKARTNQEYINTKNCP